MICREVVPGSLAVLNNPVPHFSCAARVGSDTKGEFQTLKRVMLTLNKFCQGIQRADQAMYHVLTKCAKIQKLP